MVGEANLGRIMLTIYQQVSGFDSPKPVTSLYGQKLVVLKAISTPSVALHSPVFGLELDGPAATSHALI